MFVCLKPQTANDAVVKISKMGIMADALHVSVICKHLVDVNSECKLAQFHIISPAHITEPFSVLFSGESVYKSILAIFSTWLLHSAKQASAVTNVKDAPALLRRRSLACVGGKCVSR